METEVPLVSTEDVIVWGDDKFEKSTPVESPKTQIEFLFCEEQKCGRSKIKRVRRRGMSTKLPNKLWQALRKGIFQQFHVYSLLFK